MNVLLEDRPQLKALPPFVVVRTAANSRISHAVVQWHDAKPVVPHGPDEEWECEIRSIHLRAITITPVLEHILEIRPPSHWGINE